MKTTIELPEEVLQRAKITAIQRKTTLKELIYRSLLRELDEPTMARPDPNELSDAFSRSSNTDASIGRFDREQAQRNPSTPLQTLAEDKLPYVIDPRTGMAMARTLGTPGIKKVSLAESLAIIEQANEEEALSRAGNPR